MSAATAEKAGITTRVTITGPGGSLALDVVVVDMPDAVVWVPQNSVGCQIASIGCRAGDVVAISTEVTK
ncbi:hypothetical protein X956_08260 [Trueperella pyogenes TP8]|nr:hypothetical protein [Trueperella pyogenes]AJC70670.1 hypothetical protein X956_08260 [Trueperella pyogenes TP8]